jgi:hypothetical protein
MDQGLPVLIKIVSPGTRMIIFLWSSVFWYHSCWVGLYQCFGKTFCLCHQGSNMKAVSLFQMLEPTCQTYSHNPQGHCMKFTVVTSHTFVCVCVCVCVWGGGGVVRLMLTRSKFRNSDFVDTLISTILNYLPPTKISHWNQLMTSS